MSAARSVYVISDLHLGGAYPDPNTKGDRGFRICTHSAEVTAFIASLTAKPTDPSVELVINGDLVDFLAESDGVSKWSPFTQDPADAVRKFKAIAGRDSNIFGALKDFLARGHKLVLLLGNHDIELSLPAVREALIDLIDARGKNFVFLYDGEAYRAGDALIEHGNRYDAWNMVDYDGLRRIRSLQSRGLPVPEDIGFRPPAGSFMVATVINPIKTAYTFIDLLKPETAATVPLVLALEPGYRGTIAKAAVIKFQSREHKLESAAMPAFGGDISAAGGTVQDFGSDISSMGGPSGGNGADRALDAELSRVMGTDAQQFNSSLQTLSTGSSIGSDISAMSVIERGLSFIGLLTAKAHTDAAGRLPLLLTAFQPLLKDQTFDPTIETAPEYINAAKELAKNGIKHVVFGHTHLPKRIGLPGGGFYLNSGTWANVLKFPREILSGSHDEALEKLKHFADMMTAGDYSEWTIFQPGYVRLAIGADDQVTSAELCQYVDGAPV
jgi:UDP-2,3-diacylglucosamine pyrophosphatase LpxH